MSGLVVALLAPAASAAARTSSAAASTAGSGSATPLVNLVDTRVGSAPGAADFGTGGGAGSTYPGAVAPFGMVQLSPDTIPSYGNYGGFYTYGDHELRGFSLTHISGGGCAALGDVPILPTTHVIDRSPSERKSFNIAPEYVPSFSHRGEVAHPGDYRVHLGDGIFTELTATTRTGAMRLTFPASRHASVLFNAGGSAMGDFAASLRVDPTRREISGTVTGGQFCLSYGHDTVHFVAQFSRPFSASGTWTKQTLRPGSRAAHDRSDGGQNSVAGLQYRPVAGLAPSFAGNPSRGAQAGAYVSFDTQDRRRRQVVVRIGLSTASVAGAQRNLQAESQGRSFDTLRTTAKDRWEQMLERIRVQGESRRLRTELTSMLYRSLLMPNTISDADGAYGGMDGRVHHARGFTMYSNISGWDIYRSELPLVAMIDPRVASDLASSMVADEHQSGYLPKWPVLQGQNNVMVGDPADPLIAEAYAFGARQFDAGAALAAMVKGATVPGASSNGGYVERPGLTDMMRYGYVPYEDDVSVIPATVFPAKVWGTASTTLEYATDDFTIARLAAATGQGAVCRRLAPGSGDWANLLDRATATLRPRYGAGGFATDDGPASGNGFVEGSERQYQWAVPQDVAGLVSATGGRRVAVSRLKRFFRRLNAGPASVYAYLGDEPDLSVPYVFDWLGRPDLASATVRRALLELYGPGPSGYPGNDDGGQMASWWVLGALGIYPAVPGTGTLTLGAPLFTQAEVKLAHGTLDIKAPGAGLRATTVSRLTVDGRSSARAWVDWSQIDHGATVAFTLGRRAGVGTAASSAPPSYSAAQTCRS